MYVDVECACITKDSYGIFTFILGSCVNDILCICSKPSAADVSSPRTARRNKRAAPRPPGDKPPSRPSPAQNSLAPIDTKPPVAAEKPLVSPARPTTQPPDRPAGPPPAPPKPQSPTVSSPKPQSPNTSSATRFDAQTGTTTATTAAANQAASSSVSTPPQTSPAIRKDKPKLHDKPVAASHVTNDVAKHDNTASVSADANTHASASADATTHAKLPPTNQQHKMADISYIDAASSAPVSNSLELKNKEQREAEKCNSLPRNLHKPPRPPRPMTMISREDSVNKATANSHKEHNDTAVPASEASTVAGKEKKMSVSEATHL